MHHQLQQRLCLAEAIAGCVPIDITAMPRPESGCVKKQAGARGRKGHSYTVMAQHCGRDSQVPRASKEEHQQTEI